MRLATTKRAAMLVVVLLGGWWSAMALLPEPGPSLTSVVQASTRQFVREPNIDRSGNDLRRELLAPDAEVAVCERLCQDTAACKAYTFVKRSTTVPQPICWLKDSKPHGYESSCCISGVLKE